ncbi:P8 [Mycoreovirus 1]|uniref:Uncharacterized protein VP8 n=1 Tax=Cryphonectria parasitica mycoreovirus 1 (strain 9B21) TaxID=230407 RepID=VP8_MYRV9|nr:P8 [Mycoreovirus 1]Q65YU8.1 RecName: Full=Uncharacterized protein VP8 [Cryphonectria parasitica mycoreovirus 1]BAD51418.1 P8 [Cryphonectria parasitica mycoreovirus 1]
MADLTSTSVNQTVLATQPLTTRELQQIRSMVQTSSNLMQFGNHTALPDSYLETFLFNNGVVYEDGDVFYAWSETVHHPTFLDAQDQRYSLELHPIEHDQTVSPNVSHSVWWQCADFNKFRTLSVFGRRVVPRVRYHVDEFTITFSVSVPLRCRSFQDYYDIHVQMKMRTPSPSVHDPTHISLASEIESISNDNDVSVPAVVSQPNEITINVGALTPYVGHSSKLAGAALSMIMNIPRKPVPASPAPRVHPAVLLTHSFFDFVREQISRMDATIMPIHLVEQTFPEAFLAIPVPRDIETGLVTALRSVAMVPTSQYNLHVMAERVQSQSMDWTGGNFSRIPMHDDDIIMTHDTITALSTGVSTYHHHLAITEDDMAVIKSRVPGVIKYRGSIDDLKALSNLLESPRTHQVLLHSIATIHIYDIGDESEIDDQEMYSKKISFLFLLAYLMECVTLPTTLSQGFEPRLPLLPSSRVPFYLAFGV